MVVHSPELMGRTELPTPRRSLSSHTIESSLLAPSMNGICLNLAQHDPSPEVDSHLEFALEALKIGDLREAESHVQAAVDLNSIEREKLRSIAGVADQAASASRNTLTGPETRSLRSIIRRLRDPLKILLAPEKHAAARIARAERIVNEEIQAVPKETLLCATIAHELGKAKFAVLAGRVES